MKLIVGLGNPGPQYMMTRHNAGFWVTDRLATTYGAEKFSQSRNLFSYVTKVHTPHGPVVIAQPDTFMNLSGQAVVSLLNWYKIDVADLLVIHDDVALPLGKLRVQSGGGAGGQHGVEDIIQKLGGRKNFDRIKFGVGPDPGGARRADFVLKAFPPDALEMKSKMIELCAEAAGMWLSEGWKAAANKFNGIDLNPPPPPPPPPVEPPPEPPSAPPPA
jgi:peptidyl-tRNA hydrolase, PTH1 family